VEDLGTTTQDPSKDHHIDQYLQHLTDGLASKSAVEEACDSLAWVHSTAGLMSPTGSPFVKVTWEGLQKSLAKPVNKKEPLTVKSYRISVALFSDLHLATACLLSLAGFLRFSHHQILRYCFKEGLLAVKIHHSKRDQLRKGDEVLITRTRRSTCPVAKLEEYMEWTSRTRSFCSAQYVRLSQEID